MKTETVVEHPQYIYKLLEAHAYIIDNTTTAADLFNQVVYKHNHEYSPCKGADIMRGRFEKKEVDRPPLGLRPVGIWVEERIDENEAAIDRYMSVGKPVPELWGNELSFPKTLLFALESGTTTFD